MAGEVMQFDADAGNYLAAIEKIKSAKMSLRTEIGLLTKAAVGGSKEAEEQLKQQTLAMYKLDQSIDQQKQKIYELEKASKTAHAQQQADLTAQRVLWDQLAATSGQALAMQTSKASAAHAADIAGLQGFKDRLAAHHAEIQLARDLLVVAQARRSDYAGSFTERIAQQNAVNAGLAAERTLQAQVAVTVREHAAAARAVAMASAGGMNMGALAQFSAKPSGPNMIEMMTNWQLANKRAAGGVDTLADSQRRNNTLMVQGAAILDDFTNQLQNGGIGPALRAVTNNVSFMASQFSGPWAIGVTGAAVGLSILIPQLVTYLSGGTAAAKATAKQAEEFEKLKESIKDTSKELLILERVEEERDDAKRQMKFREQEAVSLNKVVAAEEKVIAGRKRIDPTMTIGKFEAEIETKRRSVDPAERAQAEAMSNNIRMDALREARHMVLENRANRQRDEELRAADKQKKKSTGLAKQAFSQFDAGLREQAKGMLAEGFDIGAIKEAMGGAVAGHPMAGSAEFAEGFDRIVREAHDQEVGDAFKAQFGPDKRLTPDEVKLQGLQDQKRELMKGRRSAEKAARQIGTPGGETITAGENKAIDKQFGRRAAELDEAIGDLVDAIRDRADDLQRDKRGVIPVNRPAGAE